MADAPLESMTSTPGRRPWQFSLRQMFAATTGVAILLGWAAWGGWIKSDAVVYLSVAVLAGVFSRNARQSLLGACILLAVIWLTGALNHLSRIYGLGCNFGPDDNELTLGALCRSALLVFCVAVFLRTNSHFSRRLLVASLVLIELFVAAVIIHAAGEIYSCSTLYEALGFKSGVSSVHQSVIRDHTRYYLLSRYPGQVLYIVAPWLLGIAAGEIVARRRKSSNPSLERL
jgi:hypothetical protein